METNGSRYYTMLIPLLVALRWEGSEDKIILSLAQERDEMDLLGLFETLTNLNFGHYEVTRKQLKRMTHEDTPLLVSSEHMHVIVMDINYKEATVFDAFEQQYRQIPVKELKGKIYGFRYEGENRESLHLQQENWFLKLILQFKSSFSQMIGLTILMILLDLMIPFFIILIYAELGIMARLEKVIIAFAGIALYFLFQVILGTMRHRIANHMSIKMGGVVKRQLFRRLMYMNSKYTENIPAYTHLNRMESFNIFSELVGKGYIEKITQFAVSVLYLITMFIWGKGLGFIPLATLVIIVVMSIFVNRIFRLYGEATKESGDRVQNNINDIVNNKKDMRNIYIQKHWVEKAQEYNGLYIMDKYKQSKFVYRYNALIHFISNTSLLFFVYGGSLQVIQGDLSIGILIGMILLYWKYLSSVRESYSIIYQFKRIRSTIEKLDKYMSIPLENTLSGNQLGFREGTAGLQMKEVSFRYSSKLKPALMNIGFEVEQGQIFGITGHGASGKTTLLKLMLGMYTPQGGRILIDDININQMEPVSLRRIISYAPRSFVSMEDTLIKNIRLYNPSISEDDLYHLMGSIGLIDYMNRFDIGVDDSIQSIMDKNLPRSFYKLLGIVQVFTRKAKVYLIDEIDEYLDINELKTVMRYIRKRIEADQGIYIIVSRNNRIETFCDAVIQLNQGRIVSRKARRKEA